jgi:hypothetical protein
LKGGCFSANKFAPTRGVLQNTFLPRRRAIPAQEHWILVFGTVEKPSLLQASSEILRLSHKLSERRVPHSLLWVYRISTTRCSGAIPLGLTCGTTSPFLTTMTGLMFRQERIPAGAFEVAPTIRFAERCDRAIGAASAATSDLTSYSNTPKLWGIRYSVRLIEVVGCAIR